LRDKDFPKKTTPNEQAKSTDYQTVLKTPQESADRAWTILDRVFQNTVQFTS